MSNITKSLFDDLFDFPYESRYSDFMRTDVEETDRDYIVKIELPSVKKEDIKISLNNGYLTIAVEKKADVDSKENKTIHKERYYGSFKRSYRVGEDIKESDISAKLENGLLTLNIRKPIPEEAKDETKYIDIN